MSFIAPLLVFLSIAGILVIVLRRSPELKDWFVRSKAKIVGNQENSPENSRDYKKYVRNFFVYLFDLLKSMGKKIWKFVLEAKEVTAPGIKKIPKKISNFRISQNPFQRFNPNYDDTKKPKTITQSSEPVEEVEADDELEQKYIQAIEDNPKDEQAFYGLARLYFKQQKFDEARETYEYLIKQHPDNPDYQIGLAKTHENLKNFGEAVKGYKKALEIKPTNLEWMLHLVDLQEKLGDIEDAIQTLQKIVKTETDSIDNHMRLANLFVTVENFAEAQTVLENVLQIEPTNEQARKLLMEIKFEEE